MDESWIKFGPERQVIAVVGVEEYVRMAEERKKSGVAGERSI